MQKVDLSIQLWAGSAECLPIRYHSTATAAKADIALHGLIKRTFAGDESDICQLLFED